MLNAFLKISRAVVAKKKLFLFVAALCALPRLQAECPMFYLDTIPSERYLTNIEVVFDEEYSKFGTPVIQFEDNFRTDLQLDRKYIISVEPRHNQDLTYGCKWFYATPETAPGNTLHWNQYEYLGNTQVDFYGSTTTERSASYGGTVTKRIGLLDACAQWGVRDVIFIINPMYKETIINQTTGETKTGYVSYYGADGANKRLYNINYLTYNVPSITHVYLIVPATIRYGETKVLEGEIYALGQTTYQLQESVDQEAWRTIQSGTISTVEARNGKHIRYEQAFTDNGMEPKRYFRLVATDVESGESSSTIIKEMNFYYPETHNGNRTDRLAGEKFYVYKPGDCEKLEIHSDLPVEQKEAGGTIEFTMPACPLTTETVTPTYTVKFMNADYTLLKTEDVSCGENATAPSDDPTIAGATFRQWSVDFTNVRKDLVVWAQYDMGSNYTFTSKMTSHKNEVNPVAYGFANSDSKAMVGDQIKFQATVQIPTSGILYFQEGVYDLNGNLNWSDGVNVANLSGNEQKVVTHSADVAWYPASNSERMWVRRIAYRFYISASGNKVYSDGYEFDVYYPFTVNTGGNIIITNQTGQVAGDDPAQLYARYGDTVYVEKSLGDNGCLHIERTLKPAGMFETGLDENGKAFFIAPGETEVIDVTVPNYAIVFDEAYPTQHYDFRSQGLGQYNAFYAEVARCGGRVVPPTEPTSEGQVFLGWRNNTVDAYADDAYLNIPAVAGVNLVFSAEWEDIPEIPLYTVTFKDWNGTVLKEEQVREGENATPPVAGGHAGYHFVGWDAPYTTVSDHTVVTALYGQDGVYHTVTFLDWDRTELVVQQVPDGESAQAPVAVQEGYEFQYWVDSATDQKADIAFIWNDMTVTAYYAVAEGIEFIPVPQANARKYMVNGNIYIALPDGQVYTILGYRLK